MLNVMTMHREKVEEIIDFDARVKKTIDEEVEYVLELKYDGVAIGIQYIEIG